jgi:hypothetical protein
VVHSAELQKAAGERLHLQSTLQDRRGPMLASVMVAPFFALFHLPAYFVAGWIVDEHTPLSQLPNVLVEYVGVVAVFAIFFWILAIWLWMRADERTRSADLISLRVIIRVFLHVALCSINRLETANSRLQCF